MELRMILYGYRKEQFDYFIESEEAEIVKEVFNRYISGETLLGIAKDLTDRQVIYYKDKATWSKQAIRRILENSHYTGDTEYPKIIDKDIYDKANGIRLDKGGDREKDTPLIMWLKSHSVCGQCGAKFSRRLHWSRNKEKWGYGCGCKYDEYIDDDFYFGKIVAVLNKVIENPELLRYTADIPETSVPLEYQREEKELNRALEQLNPQFKILKEMIFHHTSEKYNLCRCDYSEAYTDKLIEYFSEMEPLEKIDLKVLKQTAQEIRVYKSGEISIRFANMKTVESEENINGTGSDTTNAEEDSNTN